jgi:hypothetical protein
MQINILSEKQKELLPLIHQFSKKYYLVGGTAIALYLGHRTSIDFDLFTGEQIKRSQIKNILIKNGFHVDAVIYEAFDQMHLIVNSVKLTFFQFPHTINANTNFNNIIKIPTLLDLAGMKAYALGGRAKWKDYVDLYFILKYHFSIDQIIENATTLFGNFFNAKLFLEQLAFFEDIDYSEQVFFISENPTLEEVQTFLINKATDF